MKAHFFDIDTILKIPSKVWIIDKNFPNNPIIRINQSDFNLIKKGAFRNDEEYISIGNKNYWLPSDLFNNLKLATKKFKYDPNNLAFSMQEFTNPDIIDKLDWDIDMELFTHIKNTNDDIYIICSKNNKNNYNTIIKKIENKLYDMGLEIKKYYFISDTFHNIDRDEVAFKKVKLLIQHLVGRRTEGDKFTDTEITNYDVIKYYDDDLDSISLSKSANDFIKVLIDNTDESLRKVISKIIEDSKNSLYVNYVSPNKLNRFQTKEIILNNTNIMKTFEGFKFKKP